MPVTKNHPFKENDILYVSWGYEQTDIDFYQITRVSGSRIYYKKIDQEYTQEKNMTGVTSPLLNVFTSDEKRAVVSDLPRYAKDYYYATIDKKSAKLWDGKPKYYSNYY